MVADIKSWANKFKSLSDTDQTIGAMGKYYTCTYMWDMEDKKVIVEMHDGKVKNINLDPQPLDAYDFALRAPARVGASSASRCPSRCSTASGRRASARGSSSKATSSC